MSEMMMDYENLQIMLTLMGYQSRLVPKYENSLFIVKKNKVTIACIKYKHDENIYYIFDRATKINESFYSLEEASEALINFLDSEISVHEKLDSIMIAAELMGYKKDVMNFGGGIWLEGEEKSFEIKVFADAFQIGVFEKTNSEKWCEIKCYQGFTLFEKYETLKILPTLL